MFITDREAAAIPQLANLDEQDRASALADADRVYRYVRRNEFIAEADLRAYGERIGFDPDRLNLALAILIETSRLINIPEGD